MMSFKPDLTKGMLLEVFQMDPEAYNFWMENTVLPRSIKVHYFNSKTITGTVLNLFTMCPWWIIVIVWFPQIVWLFAAAYCRCDISRTNTMFMFYMYIQRNIFFIYEPYQFKIAATDDDDDPYLIITTLYVILGYTMFTIAEYILHRYMFHFQSKYNWQNSVHFAIHGSHHVAPMDENRLVLPPIFTTILRIPFTFIANILTNSAHTYHAVVAGMMTGYILYDLIHYFCHHSKWRFLRVIRKHHLRHHFHKNNEDVCNFAVTFLAILFDKLFKTTCS